MLTLQVGGFLDNSTVNGPGLRSVLFLSGCNHRCPGCHNPALWRASYGDSIPIQEIAQRIEDNLPLISGVTISGGDPFEQAANLCILAKKLKQKNLNIWVYTGYTYEALLKDTLKKTVLPYIDVLVEGPYIKTLSPSTKKFVGSNNQRILSLKNGALEKELVF